MAYSKENFALSASKCQYEYLFIFDSSRLWYLTTFCVDKSRKKTPQKPIFTIQDKGWQNWSRKRLEATRWWKCVFKKCIEVLAATDGFITSCWHISLWSQPVTCSHDPLLAVTTRYFQIWNKAVSKVTHVLHWWNSPVAIPSAHKAHRTTLCWKIGESWWMFGAFASCAPLFCLLVVHTDRTGLRVFIRCCWEYQDMP
jgi:hypothetical protein